MVGIVNTGSFAKSLWPGVNKWWGEAYAEFPVEYTDLVETETSRRNFEEEVGSVGFGLPVVKNQGESVSYDTHYQGFTTRYTHTVWALGFMITREAYEDDLYDIVGPRYSKGLAFSMRQGKEIVVANMFNRGFNSSYTGGDGKELFSTAHPNRSGGTYSNKLSVDADLSEASLEQACIDIMKYTNDRGLRISVMPKSLHIAPDNVFEAERILKSTARVGTANNDINALKEMGKFPGGIKVNHYFTDADAWFIKTSCADGTKLKQRRKIEFAMDNDFDTENAKYKASERYSVGWTDPKGWYASQGA